MTSITFSFLVHWSVSSRIVFILFDKDDPQIRTKLDIKHRVFFRDKANYRNPVKITDEVIMKTI